MALFDTYPQRQYAQNPRLDFSFLRQPLKGGNLFKTLATVLGGAALAQNPGQALGGLLGGLSAYRTARQGVLDREYADDLAGYDREQKAALAREKTALEREKMAAADRRAGLGLFGRLAPFDPTAAPSLWQSLGLTGTAPAFGKDVAGSGQKTAADIQRGIEASNFRAVKPQIDAARFGLEYLGPTPENVRLMNAALGQLDAASPMGLSPDIHFNENPQESGAYYVPGGRAYTEAERGKQIGFENQVLSDPAFIASKVKAPGIQNNARYEGTLNTRSLRRTRDTMLPYNVKRTQAETAYLNNVRTPLGLQSLQRGGIELQYLPEELGLRNRGLQLRNEGQALDNVLNPFEAGVMPPGTGPDGTYTIPSGPLKGAKVTPGPNFGAKAAKAAPKPTVAEKTAAAVSASGVDPTTYKRLKAAGFADGPQMLESFQWWDKNSPNLFRKQYSGGLLKSITPDPNHKDYPRFIQDQKEWAAKNKGAKTGVDTVDALFD